MAAQQQAATIPITVTVDVPVSADSAVCNATDNDKRIAAIADITTEASCAVVKVIGSPSNRASSKLHLLALPRELRDKIWHDVLVMPYNIAVNTYTLLQVFRFPALLATGKQAHAEAVPLYFRNNVFKCYVRAYDGAWLAQFTDLALCVIEPRLNAGFDMRPNSSQLTHKSIRLDVVHFYHKTGDLLWINRKAWLRVYHAGKCVGLSEREDANWNIVARGAFNIVDHESHALGGCLGYTR